MAILRRNTCSVGIVSDTSNGTRFVVTGYTAGYKMELYMTPQFGVLTYESSTNEQQSSIETWLTSLREARHVSRSAQQESSLVPTTLATCGLLPSTPYAEYNQHGHSWKTYQESLRLGISTSSQPICTESGMMLGGSLYRLSPWAHHRSENESGLWPTPKLRSGGGMAVRTTPGGGMRKLEDMCVAVGRRDLEVSATFREALMGLPDGWTDATPLATHSLPSWLRSHGIGCTETS